MKKSWIYLFYIAFIVTKAQTASISSTETLVVAKTDDEASTAAPSEPVTDEPNAPIKVTEMRVNSEVTMRYAHTAVVTHVRNPASKAQEATFHVLLPETAFISGFIMTLGGKSYKAYVKEKNEAKQIFNEAVSHGTGAAHIAAKARDSNHFTVSVNVEPKSVAIFNLTYEELLVRRNGVYNHAINLHPGTLVPKLEVVVHIKESQKITTLRVPEVRTGNEIDATENDAQNSKAVQTRNGDKEATITFTPDLDEQMNLIKIYKDKTKDTVAHHYWDNNEEEDNRDGVLGQFVVQYDVERSNDGEVLVNDGYFVHFLAPSSLPPLNKYVVFVLDTSSSMIGRKVEQLIAAMDAILSDLNPSDYFSIVEFNSDYSVHELKEADEPQPEPQKFSWYGSTSSSNKELVSPSLASPENIAKAKVIISRLRANGGTNIHSALSVAMDLIHKFSGKHDISSEKSNSSDAANEKAIANANDLKTKPVHELEPIIIFLTDGDPTVGETSTSRIISHVTEKNSGEMRASLFSLAFGEDADRNFLRKLSLRNEGFMRHIYEAADAALQLRDFYKQVSSPLLAHVKFTYPREQIKEGSVSKNKFRTVYAGSEVVVAGELHDDEVDLRPVVSGFCGNQNGKLIPYENDQSKIKVTRVKEFLPLERLWAYLSIHQLLDQRDASEDTAAKEHEKKALNLALKYSFVTPLTSLVVVKPNETNAVDAESVDKNNNNQFSGITPLSFNAMPQAPLSHHLLIAPPAYRPMVMGGNGDALALVGGFHAQVENEEVDEKFDDIGQISLNRADSIISSDFMPTHRRVSFGYRFDSDEDDYDGFIDWHIAARPLSFGGFQTNRRVLSSSSFITTPAPVQDFFETAATEVPDQDKYHLENYMWALALVNNTADALVFMDNGTEIVLQLSKDSNAPRGSSEESCTNVPVDAASPASGPEPLKASCVYITRCSAARNITEDDYRRSYCRVDNKYAGVCCPSSQIDTEVLPLI
ncbi:inter-alpha-trypsin inhibitor heavy chain H4-like isoform X2 [Danaus plexippus]|uniref:inter-alpha-trypsin inhibitor heavy chain H4-like isoform X2 n=1 Tax=Danaus plexippus TaxID=13037 RepID=UPI002AAF5E9C|nr:inter-alpha-trypsin inhibitor heavy chain H4-like isoform X2 [Danaus plexippus]